MAHTARLQDDKRDLEAQNELLSAELGYLQTVREQLATEAPDVESIVESAVALRMSGHATEVEKLKKKLRDRDEELSVTRRAKKQLDKAVRETEERAREAAKKAMVAFDGAICVCAGVF